MTTVTMLDTILLAAAFGWLTLCVTILVDRARYDSWAARLTDLRERLTSAQSIERERLSKAVTAREFDQLIVDGVPPEVESAIARAFLAGGRRPAVLQSALGSGGEDVWRRIRDTQVLTSARAGVVYQPLDKMLRSGDSILAAAALKLFVRLDDRRSAELLIRALVDGVHSRSRIAAAFYALSVERADTLGLLFASEEAAVRYWGARLACYLRVHQWAPQVRELTRDSDPFVRRAAAEAVGAIGTEGDARTLLDLFADPAPVVRAHAARAAASFPAVRNAWALRRLLSDGAWIVRSAAAEALGTAPRAGGVDSVPA